MVETKKVKKTAVSTGTVVKAAKAEKPKVEVKEKTAKSTPKTTEKHLAIDLFDVAGKVVGKQALSVEVFGAQVNEKLIAQAVRVYLANQRAFIHRRLDAAAQVAQVARRRGGKRASPSALSGGIQSMSYWTVLCL